MSQYLEQFLPGAWTAADWTAYVAVLHTLVVAAFVASSMLAILAHFWRLAMSKQCPMCFERVKVGARKCKHCHSDLIVLP
jgi:hypothetical protein